MINLRGRGSTHRLHLHQNLQAHRKPANEHSTGSPTAPPAPQVGECPGPRAGASRPRRCRPGWGDPGAPDEAPSPSPGPSDPTGEAGAPQSSLSAHSPLLSAPGAAGPEGGSLGGGRGTHRDHDRVFSLKLGDVLIAAVHLRLVERSEATHHFDVALGRVRHLPGCRGRRPGATPRRSVLEEVGRAEGASVAKAEGPRSAASRFTGGAAGTWAAAPGPARSPTDSLPTHHGSHGGGGASSASPLTGGAGCWAERSRRPGARAPLSSWKTAGRAHLQPARLSARRLAGYSLITPEAADWRRVGRRGRRTAHARRTGAPATNPWPRRCSTPGLQGQVTGRASAE